MLQALKRTGLCALLCCFMGQLTAQPETLAVPNTISIFLDCTGGCDQSFIRQQMTFVNYSRDPKDADVFVLIAEQNTGSGGSDYSLYFSGQKEFKQRNDTLHLVLEAGITDDEDRRALLKTLQAGLLPYLAEKPIFNQLSLNYEASKEDEGKAKDTKASGNWKNWIFSLSANGYMNGNDNYTSLSLYGNLSAERITEDWMHLFYFNSSYSRNLYRFEEEKIINEQRDYYFEHNTVKSIGEHWAAGLSFDATNSLFQNIKLAAKIRPAIEYNIFPYSTSAVRSFRLNYAIGPQYNIYLDSTIYEKERELLFRHNFSATYSVNEKWGNFYTELEGRQFLHNPKLLRMSIGIGTELRVVKGLFFNFYGSAALIRDQISLPKGDASLEEVLLQQRQLEQNYSYYFSVGLTYRFGAMFNNVVNPRFGLTN